VRRAVTGPGGGGTGSEHRWGGRWRPRGGRPPWWPEGEAWPPSGRGGPGGPGPGGPGPGGPRPGGPWRGAPERFRRRFLLAALGLLAALVGFGIAIGLAVARHRPPVAGPTTHAPAGYAPGAFFGFVGFVALVGGVATLLAYRR